MMDQLLSYATITFLGLFPIANPVGVAPTFYQLTCDNSPNYRGRQARQVAINVIIVLTIFLMVGRLILDFFGFSLGALQISGGLLIAHTAWRMITVHPSMSSTGKELGNQVDITLIPMAVPIISGPGAIGMVMGLIAKDPQPANYFGSLLGIVGIGVLVYLCLSLGGPLIRLLGKNGVDAFTRVLGFFILAIAIQMMADGTFAMLEEFPVSDLSVALANA